MREHFGLPSLDAKPAEGAAEGAENAEDARQIQNIAFHGNALPVHNIKFRCFEGRRNLIFCNLQFCAIDIVVVDSVAALVPRAEIEGEMGDSHMGLHHAQRDIQT